MGGCRSHPMRGRLAHLGRSANSVRVSWFFVNRYVCDLKEALSLNLFVHLSLMCADVAA
jgi:hypothetical protein